MWIVRLQDGSVREQHTVRDALQGLAFDGAQVAWATYHGPYDYGEIQWPPRRVPETGRLSALAFAGELLVAADGVGVSLHDGKDWVRHFVAGLYVDEIVPIGDRLLLHNDHGQCELWSLSGEKLWAPSERRGRIVTDGVRIARTSGLVHPNLPLEHMSIGERDAHNVFPPSGHVWNGVAWLSPSSLAAYTHEALYRVELPSGSLVEIARGRFTAVAAGFGAVVATTPSGEVRSFH
jgi:hypothetical protein